MLIYILVFFNIKKTPAKYNQRTGYKQGKLGDICIRINNVKTYLALQTGHLTTLDILGVVDITATSTDAGQTLIHNRCSLFCYQNHKTGVIN